MPDTEAVQFEKDKVCYAQNCETFRSLNELMWQVPLIAITVTGGLWFGVGTISNLGRISKTAILFLTWMVNWGLIAVLYRVRYIMGEYIVMRAFGFMLFMSGLLSLIGAIMSVCGVRI